MASRFFLAQVWVVMSFLLAGPAWAGGGGENVLLVVNADSFSSMTLANTYMQLRQVPACNVVYLNLGDQRDQSTIHVDTFRDRILKPVLAAIADRGLAAQIDCVVYSSDVPYAVNIQSDMPPALKTKLGPYAPYATPTAATTGLTFLHRHAMAKDAAAYLSLSANRYVRMPTRVNNSIAAPQTFAFRSSIRWEANGAPSTAATGEESYLLSTMLAWTSGRGVSVRQAQDNLLRSAGADGTNPKGTFYFMIKEGEEEDRRSRTRQGGFVSAVAQLKAMGHQAEIVEGKLPMKRADIAGLMAGTRGFDFAASGSTILPGAICEHLTSFGGQLFDGASQTSCTEFLRFGAAGTSGAVTEPFALQAKFPLPFIHVHYARGSSLAEAFYQSVSGPYQLIVLGDPLCQPWASFPTVTVESVSAGETVKGILAITPSAENASEKIAQWLLFANGKRVTTCPPGGKLRLDTLTLPDGRNELRIVGVRADAIMTQGRAVVTVYVLNGGNVAAKAELAADLVMFGQSTTLTASAKTASKIIVTCNGRELGVIKGESGTLTIDSKRLGVGMFEILCEAVPGATPMRRLMLPPVSLQVEEPTEQSAASEDVARRLTPIAIPEGKKKTDGWFDVSGRGAVRDKPFTLHGYVKANERDLHQLQAFFDGELTVEVNGQPVAAQHSVKGWRHFPMNLQAGWHELKITGTAKGTPAMTLYFGGRGTQRLTAERIYQLPK